MAKGKYHIFSTLVFLFFMCFSLYAKESFVSTDSSAKYSYHVLTDADEIWQPTSASRVLELMMRKSMRQVYHYTEDRLIWAIAFPLEWACKTMDKLEAIKRYIGRKLSADTDVDVGDNKLDVKLCWRF